VRQSETVRGCLEEEKSQPERTRETPPKKCVRDGNNSIFVIFEKRLES
jgi:hypothetical protein